MRLQLICSLWKVTRRMTKNIQYQSTQRIISIFITLLLCKFIYFSHFGSVSEIWHLLLHYTWGKLVSFCCPSSICLEIHVYVIDWMAHLAWLNLNWLTYCPHLGRLNLNVSIPNSTYSYFNGNYTSDII